METRNFSQKNYPGFDSVPPAMDRIGDAIDRYFVPFSVQERGCFYGFLLFLRPKQGKPAGKVEIQSVSQL